MDVPRVRLRRLYALNADTGAKVWSFRTKGVVSSPAVANGIVYVAGGPEVIALGRMPG